MTDAPPASRSNNSPASPPTSEPASEPASNLIGLTRSELKPIQHLKTLILDQARTTSSTRPSIMLSRKEFSDNPGDQFRAHLVEMTGADEDGKPAFETVLGQGESDSGFFEALEELFNKVVDEGVLG